VHVLSPDQLNTYDVLKSDDVVFSVEALNAYISANTNTADEPLARRADATEEVSA
jgi:large subunit ribosomal protein L4